MYKCPKCDYQSENPGNCPHDNEALVVEQETVQTPESAPEESTPKTTPSENQETQ